MSVGTLSGAGAVQLGRPVQGWAELDEIARRVRGAAAELRRCGLELIDALGVPGSRGA